MSSSDKWLQENYDDLVSKYAGNWVLIKNKKVIFADKSFELVYKKSKELCDSNRNCIIEMVDSGEAVLYDITVSNSND